MPHKFLNILPCQKNYQTLNVKWGRLTNPKVLMIKYNPQDYFQMWIQIVLEKETVIKVGTKVQDGYNLAK